MKKAGAVRRGGDAAIGRGKTAPAGMTGRGEGGVVVKFEPFYRVARRIPRGKVATYGQVAALAGRPRGARLCGYALSALRGTVHDVPWQRVLGARGAGRAGISLRDPVGAAAQRALLEREGVEVDARGRVELERFGWRRGAKSGR
jgi:methylated-DNA-protein-cysteine methyltransferase-like protein